MLESTFLIAFISCLCYLSWQTCSHILRSKLWKSFCTCAKSVLVKLGLKKPQLPIPSAGATSTNRAFPRLARHPLSIKPEYDVVVVGSGYGGGVAASRMVRAGKSVCVLELGKEIWPGEYPHTLKDAMREYSLSGRILGKMVSIGKAAGLYHTVKGEGQDVFLGCGLGGTSLINAGVFLKPDERLLEAAEWPEEIRENPADLEQCEY
jgi:NADPH-dependent 2,4-dienoyl-CoA reductase/sulfur reductase-like enzyme